MKTNRLFLCRLILQAALQACPSAAKLYIGRLTDIWLERHQGKLRDIEREMSGHGAQSQGPGCRDAPRGIDFHRGREIKLRGGWVSEILQVHLQPSQVEMNRRRGPPIFYGDA